MRDKKPQRLRELVAQHNAAWEGSLGVGDSESDIPLLSIVAQPIAFNPTRQLFEHAQAHGWRIVLERKSVVYQLAAEQGMYRLVDKND